MCGCSKNTVVPNNVYSQPSSPPAPDLSCGVTLHDLIIKKAVLQSLITPENTGFINSQLGLIESMINSNNPCRWEIQ